MKLELLILFITFFVLLNTYFEGKLINKLKHYEKYYKMAFFAFIGLCIYLYMMFFYVHNLRHQQLLLYLDYKPNKYLNYLYLNL